MTKRKKPLLDIAQLDSDEADELDVDAVEQWALAQPASRKAVE